MMPKTKEEELKEEENEVKEEQELSVIKKNKKFIGIKLK